jgi:hypothetical protein
MIRDSSTDGSSIDDQAESYLLQSILEYHTNKVRVAVQERKRVLQFGDLKAFGE